MLQFYPSPAAIQYKCADLPVKKKAARRVAFSINLNSASEVRREGMKGATDAESADMSTASIATVMVKGAMSSTSADGGTFIPATEDYLRN